MESSPQRQRSRFVSNSREFQPNSRSDSFSFTEEQGAVGGCHTVRHDHHHYHHHYIHTVERDNSRDTRRRSQSRRRQPEFSFTDNPSPPSYEEAVSGVAATSSPIPIGSRVRDIGVAPEAGSPWSFPPQPRHDASPLHRSWTDNSDLGDESEDPEPCGAGSWDEVDPVIFEQLSSRGSPARSEPEHARGTEDFLSVASVSPPISQLSLGSNSTSSTDFILRTEREEGTILSSRKAVKKVLLEIVLYLQRQQDWCSADAAWDYLVERVCGYGRSAQREAEILWEFAFQAHPLAHFGSILSEDPVVVEHMIESVSD